MKRLMLITLGWALCTATLAAALWALNGQAFAYYLNDRILEHSRIQSVEGVFFKPETRSIVQPIDMRLLHVGRADLDNTPVCLRLWMGSKFLVNIDQKLRVHVRSGQQQWTAGPAFTHHKTRLFCFESLNVSIFRSLDQAEFELEVLDASDTQNLAAIHAGPGRDLLPAQVNGKTLSTSLYYMIEAQAKPQWADWARHLVVLLLSGAVAFLVIPRRSAKGG